MGVFLLSKSRRTGASGLFTKNFIMAKHQLTWKDCQLKKAFKITDPIYYRKASLKQGLIEFLTLSLGFFTFGILLPLVA